MDNVTQIAAVNDRLKKGEGWIGYRSSKNDAGEKVRSKFLYFAFYQSGVQKFVNTKTNDPEAAYRQLLEAEGWSSKANGFFPRRSAAFATKISSASCSITTAQIDQLASIIGRPKTAGPKRASLAWTSSTLLQRLPVTEIRVLKIKGFIHWRRKEGDADSTIRRQLGHLRLHSTVRSRMKLSTE